MKKFWICMLAVFFLSFCGDIWINPSVSEHIRDAGEVYVPPAKKPVYKKKSSSSSSSSSNVHYHNSNNSCSATHCSHRWCSCGSGASHTCGGGCTWGAWQLYNGTQHVQLCTRGCGRTNGLHNATWNSWSSNHTIQCSQCTLVGSHSAIWEGNYTINAQGNHERKCTNTYITYLNGQSVSINTGKSCVATYDVHAPEFTAAYYKVNGSSESDGTSPHKRDCQHSGCNRIETHNPIWGEWSSISDDQHRRGCAFGGGCALTQTLSHTKVYTPIEGDIRNHIVTCNSGDVNHPCPYYAIKSHVDSNPKDGKCDQCYTGQEHTALYEIIHQPAATVLTNDNVTVFVTMYDAEKNADIVKSHVYTGNNLNDLSEDRYEFIFDGIDTSKDQIRPEVNHINKTVSGRIKYEPNTPTPDPVKITFLPDYEEETYGDYRSVEYGGRSKKIYARILIDGVPKTDWIWDGDGILEYEFRENGSCEIELADTVGNGNYEGLEGKQSVRIPVVVDWIISGQATVATTSDVLENGTIFTDVLINADREWTIEDAQEQIAVNIYKILDDKNNNITGIEKITDDVERNKLKDKITPVKISKLEVKDYNENRITDTSIGRGLYYIKVGIGGPGVFTIDPEQQSTRYIVEISTVNPNPQNSSSIDGKNRIEVTVNKLNDLT